MAQNLPMNSGKLLRLTVSDKTTDYDTGLICDELEKAIAESGKIRLLLTIEGFRNMDPDLLLEKINFAKIYADNIERMAVVANRVWIKSWIQLGGLFFTRTEVEYFDRSQMESALRWIQE